MSFLSVSNQITPVMATKFSIVIDETLEPNF